MFEWVKRLGRRVIESYATFVVLGLLVGVALSPVAWTATAAPDGTVAVVPVGGTIDGRTATNYGAMLQEAREDPSIEAVVLVVNSGGGSAAASEEMYLQTKRTAAEMPVVASVDAAAASGAYYTIAPSDHIYAKPSSIVGSIGVLAPTPPDLEPNSLVATSGPNKLAGADQREFYYTLESLQQAFVGAVVSQRGDRLSFDRAELKQARIYGGAQAAEGGLVDTIGDRQAAVRRAAEMAGISDPRVEVLRPENATQQFLSRGNYLASTAPNKTMVTPEYLIGDRQSPTVFLMVPPSYVAAPRQDPPENGTRAPPTPNASDTSTEVNHAAN